MRIAHKAAPILLLAAVLAAVPATPAGAYHRQRQRDIQREIEAKRRAIRQADRRERTLVELIAESDGRRAVLSRKVNALEGKLAEARAELRVLEARIDAYAAELRVKNRQLELTLGDLYDGLTVLNGRISNLYIYAPAAMTQTVIGIEEFADVLAERQYAASVVRADMELVDRIEQTRDVINAQRKDIADKQSALVIDRRAAVATVARIGAVRNEHARARAGVQREIDHRESLLDQVRRQKREYRRAIENLKVESANIASFLRGRQRGQRVISGRGGWLRWPISGQITSPFGWRTHPVYRHRSFHTGIDVSSPTGTPIGAARSGKVLSTGYHGAYGLLAIVDHGDGVATVYAHMSRVYVRVGEQVSTGQALGAVGSTGWSTGPHLHFETRSSGEPQNPVRWL